MSLHFPEWYQHDYGVSRQTIDGVEWIVTRKSPLELADDGGLEWELGFVYFAATIDCAWHSVLVWNRLERCYAIPGPELQRTYVLFRKLYLNEPVDLDPAARAEMIERFVFAMSEASTDGPPPWFLRTRLSDAFPIDMATYESVSVPVASIPADILAALPYRQPPMGWEERDRLNRPAPRALIEQRRDREARRMRQDSRALPRRRHVPLWTTDGRRLPT